jgi:hypothetical protein
VSDDIPLTAQIEWVQTQSRQRGRVFPRLLADGKITRDKAVRETATIQAVLATLRQVQLQRRRTAHGREVADTAPREPLQYPRMRAKA